MKKPRRLLVAIIAFVVALAVGVTCGVIYWKNRYPYGKTTFDAVIEEIGVGLDGVKKGKISSITFTVVDATDMHGNPVILTALFQDDTKFRTQRGKKITAAELRIGQTVRLTTVDMVTYNGPPPVYSFYWRCYKVVILDESATDAEG